jgi:hypothetical protein
LKAIIFLFFEIMVGSLCHSLFDKRFERYRIRSRRN